MPEKEPAPPGPIDLLDPSFYVGDPHPAYRWMRENDPIHRDEKNGLWAITRLDDVREVEKQADVFSSQGHYRANVNMAERTMIGQDDPAHGAQRRLLSDLFTPRAVAQREQEVRTLVAGLCDRYLAFGPIDAVDVLAARIPATLTARMLGLDDAHWRHVKLWSERLMRIDRMPFEPGLLVDGILTLREMDADLQTVLRARDAELQSGQAMPDDIPSRWVRAARDGDRMDYPTALDEMGLLVSGGAETTRTTIARALVLFCEHPEAWETLAREPARIPTAVEEILRFVTPLNQMFRRARVATEIAGRAIAEGDRLILLYPSANRDERHFDEPDRFRIDRDPNPHIAFGFGTHFCLGAAFARMTLRVVFEELTRRLTHLRPAAPPEYEANVFVKAVRRFDLAFDLR